MDSLTKMIGKLAQETITLIDSLIKTTSKLAQEAVTLADSITKFVSKTFAETISFVDILTLNLIPAFVISIGNFIVQNLYGIASKVKIYLMSFALQQSKTSYVVKEGVQQGTQQAAKRSFTINLKP